MWKEQTTQEAISETEEDNQTWKIGKPQTTSITLIWKVKVLRLHTKIKLFNSNVERVLL